MAAHSTKGTRGGRGAKRGYQPCTCGLCGYERVYDSRTGLNNHATKQHGYYYSLKRDSFVLSTKPGGKRFWTPSTTITLTGWARVREGAPRVGEIGVHCPVHRSPLRSVIHMTPECTS